MKKTFFKLVVLGGIFFTPVCLMAQTTETHTWNEGNVVHTVEMQDGHVVSEKTEPADKSTPEKVDKPAPEKVEPADKPAPEVEHADKPDVDHSPEGNK
ncbi:MAG TPA: hypothetical protein VK808_09240 [Bacteroidia bacterium]|jgi:hypothetical protein|nr:hypothetical protein [Bacteroidia bacterium]